ncbi:MAG: DUF6345 domain-containing protein [Acidobacteriota bacterium]|nr:DUF6345 domain-containing protein [Acidobacteriota bacterium]
MKLPVFKVASTIAPAERIRDLGKHVFPREDHQIVERGTKVELRSKIGNVEIDVGRGGVWAADESRLWRFDPASEKKTALLAKAEASRLSLDLLKNYGVMPEITAPFRLKTPKTTGAVTVYSAKQGAPRQVTQEDTTVLAEVEVDVSEYGLRKKTLPIVGGGGRFSVVYGEAGRLLAARGVWRPVVGKPVLQEVIEQAKADEIYRTKTAGVPLAKFSSELAYYSAPAFSEQNLLYPVYVYSGVADYQGNLVPLRKVLVPAVEIEPISQQPPSPPMRRTKDSEPIIRPLPADFKLQPGKSLPPGIAVNRRLMRDKGLKFNELFAAGAVGTQLTINPGVTAAKLKELTALLGYYSAGTSWIGVSGGLGGSQNNAKGFVDELAALGWNIRFNWGDHAAWESDWRRNDDQWVDAVDFVFYTGHANSDGWVLAAPDDDFLHFTETAGSPDLWGANNAEWIVVAACGPLQDEVVGSGGNVLDRWRNAFDGLHILMGYAQVTYDNEEEGKRLIQYAKAGSTIIQSWFRTAQEIQPSDPIWAGAYYVGDSTGSTGNDHLWGVGSVGPDIASPTWRACSWVPC